MRTKGRFTRALSQLTPKDIVKVRGPFGGFVFDADRDTNTVMFAGGIGITPLISMIRYAHTLKLPNKITLYFSCANQDDIPFLEELRTIERNNPNFHAVYVIGEGPTEKLAGQQVTSGRLDADTVASIANDTSISSYFICGPPPFMSAITGHLRHNNVPFYRIFTEAFGQASHRQTGKIKSWPFNVYVLGALGVVVGSFVILASDLLKILPPSTLLGMYKNKDQESLTSSRQVDLDRLVNELPDSSENKPPSQKAQDALNTANSNQPSQQQSTNSTPSSNQQTAPQQKTTQTPSATTPSQQPQSTPSCYTNQSGVTVCQ